MKLENIPKFTSLNNEMINNKEVISMLESNLIVKISAKGYEHSIMNRTMLKNIADVFRKRQDEIVKEIEKL